MIGKHFQVRRVLLALLAIGGVALLLLISFSYFPEVMWTARMSRRVLLYDAARLADEIETFAAAHGRPPQSASDFQKPEFEHALQSIARLSHGRVGRPLSRAIIPERGPLLVISGDATRLVFYPSGAIGASRCLIPKDMTGVRDRELVPLTNEGWQGTACVSWALPEPALQP